MGLVLQFGWLGETEALYTLVVAASLIVWRWADATGKPPLWGWCGGYGLAALGMLTKGPQAPVYFIGGVAMLSCWPCAAGASCCAGSMSWALDCSLRSGLPGRFPSIVRVGPAAAWTMLSGDIGMRFQDGSWMRTLTHFVEFPLSVAACMLPWCVLLLAYLRRDFRRSIAFAREDVWFLGHVDRRLPRSVVISCPGRGTVTWRRSCPWSRC